MLGSDCASPVRRPDFVKKNHDRRRAANDVARGRLAALQGEAVDAIGDLMANGASERVRLAAALEVMKLGVRAETEELGDRVATLEAKRADGASAPAWNPPTLLGDRGDLRDE
jgi:hypothetical protein